MSETLSIVIPAYNEERTIHLILDKVKQVELIGAFRRNSLLRMIVPKMIRRELSGVIWRPIPHLISAI